jgi:arylsulfatase A-like enzyme
MRNQQRRESLASADRAVRSVLKALRGSGEMKNTYVLFTSDNGFLLGEHRFASGKDQPYEPASHLPLLIKGPGVPQGQHWRGMAGTQDLAPTILVMADATADVTLDGHSVLPSAAHALRDRGRAILLEGAAVPVDAENGGPVRYAPLTSRETTPWRYHGLVTRRWKIISWDQYGTYELYHLAEDPYELTNVYYDLEYAEKATALTRRLEQLWLCRGTSCNE